MWVRLLGLHHRIISQKGLDVHGFIPARDPRAGVATGPLVGENSVSEARCFGSRARDTVRSMANVAA